nr:chalcone isomerase [Astragalus sinicus]
MGMATMATLTPLKVEFVEFPTILSPPRSNKSFFLGGAGVRGLDINGQFITFTGIGVYLEESDIASLASKWKGKTPDELMESLDFYRDIIKGPSEKLVRSTKLKTLDGREYVRKVSENCVSFIKSEGTHSEAEEKAVEEFTEAFKDQVFPPGSTVYYRQSPGGNLGLGFSKDETIPEYEHAVINNKALSEAVLETMIGEIPVSPALKLSLATRLSELFKSIN